MQRNRLYCGKGFNGPVEGCLVVELCSPWQAMLTLCRGCVGRVWAVLYMGDGADGVVVNRSILLFCGLGCIYITPYRGVAHARPSQPSLAAKKTKVVHLLAR